MTMYTRVKTADWICGRCGVGNYYTPGNQCGKCGAEKQ